MTSDWIFKQIAEFGDKILFWDVFWWSDKLNMPFLIFFLLFASVYFSFITGFVNIRKLPYAIVKFIKSKGTVNQKDGTISPKLARDWGKHCTKSQKVMNTILIQRII